MSCELIFEAPLKRKRVVCLLITATVCPGNLNTPKPLPKNGKLVILQKLCCDYLPFLSWFSTITNSFQSIRKTSLTTSRFIVHRRINLNLGCRKLQVFASRSTLGLMRNEKSELSLNVRESQTTFECVSLIRRRKSHFKQTEQVSLSR